MILNYRIKNSFGVVSFVQLQYDYCKWYRTFYNHMTEYSCMLSQIAITHKKYIIKRYFQFLPGIFPWTNIKLRVPFRSICAKLFFYHVKNIFVNYLWRHTEVTIILLNINSRNINFYNDLIFYKFRLISSWKLS